MDSLRLIVVLGTAALLPLAAGGAAAATQSRGAAPATNRSIIIFRNQLTGLPANDATASARIRAANSTQAGVLAELRQAHATHVHSFHVINAISATISSAQAARLRENSAVLAVVQDAVRHFDSLDTGPGPAIAAVPALTARARQHRGQVTALSQQTCPADPSKPLVEPEALQLMSSGAANKLADGAGIKVAIIADGIDPNLPDLIRPGGGHVLFDYRDFSGFGPGAPTDGREAFLDAGAIASQGNQTYDLSGFVNPAHPLPPGCNIKIKGIAPGAGLAVLNVAGSSPVFFDSQILQAIEWAVLHDHVNVLTEPFGGNPVPDTQNDPVALANKAAVAAGVFVVAGSGDAGPFDNIGSAASTPGVIAVGATTAFQLYVQTSSSGAQFGTGWEDSNIAALSSAGITEFSPHTVDVVAPGDSGWALCSSDTTAFTGCANPDHGAEPQPLTAVGGTSASAAETAGTAALVMQAYARSHHGALPSPGLVKRIIVSTATDLGAPADHQGAGLVDAVKAVRLALSIGAGASGRRGSTLLVSKPSLTATVEAGKKAAFSVIVTNEGTKPRTVTPTVSGRPTTIATDRGTIRLSASAPTFVDGSGNADGFATHQFAVPAGAGNLNGNITWNDQSVGGAVFETLFDPMGHVAASSVLGTNQSGFGHVEVHNPTAGTWTAVIFTVSHNQYVGPVKFSFSSERFRQTGTVSPASRRLAPGQAGAFKVTVGPADDRGLKLHLGTGGSTDGSIPIIVRALVPLTANGGSFKGTLTGGAANFSGGQELTYQFDVPARKPSLNVGIRVAGPGYPLEGFLIDPNGQPLDAQATGNDKAGRPAPAVQFYRRSPAAGRWTLVLLAVGFDNGTRLSEPFTGKIFFTPPKVTSTGIPNSPGKVLRAGHPVKATITVTNTGNSAKSFFADPRLAGQVRRTLTGSDVRGVTLPLPANGQPNWLIPTGTTRLDVTARGTVPITMDVSWLLGDPDVLGRSSADRSAASLAAPEIAPGLFFAFPEATGPLASATTGKVSLTAVARTNAFDPAVTSSTGDVWARSFRASAPYSPLTITPGRKGTITLTITPKAPRGTVVHGFIDVDTFDPATASGDELARIPYTYKVG